MDESSIRARVVTARWLTFASVEAFTFFLLRIARIVLRSTPVSLVVFRGSSALIDSSGWWV